MDTLAPGQRWRSQGRTITETDLVMFSALTWDHSRAHTDASFASPLGGERVVHGVMGLSYAIGLLTRSGWLDEAAIALISIDGWTFRKPVHVGATIFVESEILSMRPSSKGNGTGVWTAAITIRTDEGVAQEGSISVLAQMEKHA